MTERKLLAAGVVLAEAADALLPDEDIYWVVLGELPGDRVSVAPADLDRLLGAGDVWLGRFDEALSDYVYGLAVRLRLAVSVPVEWCLDAKRRELGALAPAATRALCEWHRLRILRDKDAPAVEVFVDETTDRYAFVVRPIEDTFDLRQREEFWLDRLERPKSDLEEAEDIDVPLVAMAQPLHWQAADDAEPLENAEVQEAFDLDCALPAPRQGARMFRHLAPRLGALVISVEGAGGLDLVEIAGRACERTPDGFTLSIETRTAQSLGELATAPIRMCWSDGCELWIGP